MRTNAKNFLKLEDALNELDNLKITVTSLAVSLPLGAYARLGVQNVVKGIAARIDYLHDSFSKLGEAK